MHAAGRGTAGEGRAAGSAGRPSTLGGTGGEGLRVESATAVQLLPQLLASATSEMGQEPSVGASVLVLLQQAHEAMAATVAAKVGEAVGTGADLGKSTSGDGTQDTHEGQAAAASAGMGGKVELLQEAFDKAKELAKPEGENPRVGPY